MSATIVLLPGDGIGPEVVDAAERVLEAVAELAGHQIGVERYPIGGAAIDAGEQPLPPATEAACLASDAVLLGAVGGPKWDNPAADIRPEQGLLGIRQAMGLYANLRPVIVFPALRAASPLRPDYLQGVDLLVVRELTGGIYFGQPRERRREAGEWLALDTMVYREHEIRRIAHLAFRAARGRSSRVTSVDKANVLESSRLWRQTVAEVGNDYPDVTLEHLLVDAAAMDLLRRPADFDVLLTTNLFGDILSDEASMLTGSLGNLPSASLGSDRNAAGHPRGLYEPVHGSAPDIAGKGIANPIATILSLAMLMRHSLGWATEAAAVEDAVARVLTAGHRTVDLARNADKALNTNEITTLIVSVVEERLEQSMEEEDESK